MLENGPDYAEVYTEVTKSAGKKVHATLVWKLKNTSEDAEWAKDMQLIPVMSSPTLRIHFESNICQLAKSKVGELKLRVRIPSEYTASHLILMLKLK